MPRSKLAGPTPPSTIPDYFDSLEALAQYSSSDQPRPATHRIPLSQPRKRDTSQGNLVVCHDYKGGYTETGSERGYTFQFWHLCDTYIYFSHHRISLPPPSFIRTAHRNGTRILGTLIFEWDAGRSDILELIYPNQPHETIQFNRPSSFEYADLLVRLAEERGIDGWLVNVEVELGGQRMGGGGGEREGTREHARALLKWLEYFKEEMHKRVPGSQVMWYDAVTIEGKLSWQNALTPRNLPFLLSCDSIFLNYHWTPSLVTSTLSLLSSSQFPTTLDPSQIHFGIDVFGRGTFGGGGFETSKAISTIQNIDPRLSIALFAPGWTVESSNLSHSLSTRETYTRWFQDEMFFWSNGPTTRSVPLETERQLKFLRDQAGIDRARRLAVALYKNPRVPLSFRPPLLPHEFKLSSINLLPGPTKPINHLVDSKRPRPVSMKEDGMFYSNFSGGSGHSFFSNGEEIDRSEKGWTDVDYTFPFPSLLFLDSFPGVSAVSFTEDPRLVWEGNRSILLLTKTNDSTSSTSIDVSKSITTTYDLFQLESDVLEKGSMYRVQVVWKSLENIDRKELDPKELPFEMMITPIPNLFVTDLGGGGGQVERLISKELGEFNPGGGGGGGGRWRGTTSLVKIEKEGTRFEKVSVVQEKRSSIVIGAVSIYPVETETLDGPKIGIGKLRYDGERGSVEWENELGRFSEIRGENDPVALSMDLNRPRCTPRFVQYHVYRRKEDGGKEVEDYLGTTRENRFELGKDIVRGYTVIVRGVGVDGTVVEDSIVL